MSSLFKKKKEPLPPQAPEIPRQSQDLLGISKLKGYITQETTAIQRAREEIGRLYSGLHPEDYEPIYADAMQRIRESEEKIRDYRHRQELAQGGHVCKCCGARLERGALFCEACGLRVVSPEPEDSRCRCTRCGMELRQDARYCGFCGLRVGEPLPIPTLEVAPIKITLKMRTNI